MRYKDKTALYNHKKLASNRKSIWDEYPTSHDEGTYDNYCTMDEMKSYVN